MSATGVEPAVLSPPAGEIEPGRGGSAGRRRRVHRDTFGSHFTPYGLALPTLVVLALIFGYPFYRLIQMSFQAVLSQNLFRKVPPSWVGLRQYTSVLQDSQFWTIALRTVVFTAATVVVSVTAAMLMAMLLNRVSRWARIMLTTVLMFVWAVPQVVSIKLFAWLTDPNFGVVNWLLNLIPGVHMDKHDWFLDPHQGLSVASTVVVWGAIPFLAITLHAGMTMVPKELIEAARMDGANAWRVFRAVTLPILRPLLIIITTLSIVWDIQVFNQIWILRNNAPGENYWTLAIFTYDKAISGGNYNSASAIGVITVLLMLGVMVFYIRQIFRIGDND
jgi:N,N'-diacetylchitobiose transport system permease protein